MNQFLIFQRSWINGKISYTSTDTQAYIERARSKCSTQSYFHIGVSISLCRRCNKAHSNFQFRSWDK